ncbi:uncharacterized protein LOC123535569 [Mercenaria mercenaria]|uniref:uncharacterized protein LOC123535569 n=1 Tax=Mercenaria mercenaria TaxID=6596 RepID=UPI00234E6B7C|nr:uncharacterized protein LOC123535569 [Mercenaria mercenaria]XP_045174198.2 uncharacterized protein LOC123535569 [Mercenaria mercenaria]
MELDTNIVVHRQKLFGSALKSYFLRKITKYQNILLKNGIHLSNQSYSCDDSLAMPGSQSFEDQIELVIGHKSASPSACKAFWKIGNRISTIKLFRWIYLIVQRTKAARILHHLDGISEGEIETVIKSVGEEIAVAFEYQLYLLEGDLEIIKLAQHAGACIITYLNSKEAHYAPESLLQAILEVKPQSNSNKEILKTRTICFKNQQVCLRWRLSQVLKQPGLRTIPSDMGEVSNEKSSPEKGDEQPQHDDEKVDGILQGAPNNLIETQQSVNIEQDKSKEELNSVSEDLTTTKNTENDNTTSGENVEEKQGNTLSTNSSGHDESLIYVAESKKTRKHRRITAVDMDFEKGVMKVTDYSVEASDFSPIGNETSQVDGSDSTSIDEDLDSEHDNVECNLLENRNSINTLSLDNSLEENAIPRNLESAMVSSADGVKLLKNRQLNKTNKDNKLDEFVSDEQVASKNEEIENVFDTGTCNKNGENNSDIKMLNEDGAECSGIYTTEYISHNSVNTQSNITNNTGDLYDQKDVHAHETDVLSSDNTYQSKQEPNITTVETVVTQGDDSMPDVASIDKSYIFYGCFTPYGAKCRPEIYGYRGPLHVWNEVERCYTLIYNDTVTVTRKNQRQIKNSSLDFHQTYIPKTVCRH